MKLYLIILRKIVAEEIFYLIVDLFKRHLKNFMIWLSSLM